MKGSLLTLLFCHFLFLQSFASQHGRRRNLKHHLLARESPLDQRSANPADDPLGIRDTAILDTIRERRVSNIIGGLSDTKADIPAWCVFLTTHRLNAERDLQAFLAWIRRQMA